MLEQRGQDRLTEKKQCTPARNPQRPFPLKQSQLRKFLRDLQENGRAEETVRKYRSDLNRYYAFLGEEKLICSDSLPRWREQLIAEGYAARSVNASIVAVNSFYNSIGCREWQCFDWLELPESDAMELTREEYWMLLREAWQQENIQLYLLIKILACTELTPSEIPLITREAVDAGIVTGKKRGGQETFSLPQTLRDDLLEYAIHRGIRSGPVFLNDSKKSLPRTSISKQIAALGEDLGLEPGKANPRNLRRLYLKTLSEFQNRARAWVAQSYRAQLIQEEATIGWKFLLKDGPVKGRRKDC